jgi:hypothetical protein
VERPCQPLREADGSFLSVRFFRTRKTGNHHALHTTETIRRWLLFAIAPIVFGQEAPIPDAPDSVFVATTKLVQVSVIAQDKIGRPVVDLRREEFQLLDNGAPQEIRLFLPEVERTDRPPVPPSNAFTNQVVSSSGVHSGYSVILIDNLFTDFGDPTKQEEGSGLARVQTLKC